MKKFILALALIGWPIAALARPVSYPGGWTLMQMNDGDVSSLHLHYSPTAKTSIGYKGELWRDQKWQFHGVQVNHLLHRWNGPSSQANLYLKTALGLAESDAGTFDHEVKPAGFVAIAADWETRRWFTSYEARYTEAGHIDHFAMQSARVGVAPYIGDYGDLHSWLMLQLDHKPGQENNLVVTPLVRLFKDVTMAEVGFSSEKELLFNVTYRF